MIEAKPRQLIVDLDTETGAIVGITRVLHRVLKEGGKVVEALAPAAEAVEKDQWDDVLLAAGQASAGEFAAAHERTEKTLADERAEWAEERIALETRITELEAAVSRENQTNQQLTAIVAQVRKTIIG